MSVDVRLKRIALGTALVAGLGAGGLLVSHFFVGAQEGEHLPGNLLAQNRTHLSLCVDTASSGSVAGQQIDRVSAALDTALARASRVPPEYDQPSVVPGCPPAMPLTGERITFQDRYRFSLGVSDPALVSPHRVFVYFVADDLYTASFGDSPYGRATGETLCEGHTCFEVTVSVYLPNSANASALADAFTDALVLIPPPKPSTPDWQVCALGTPAPWCVRYEDHLAGELDE